jgi:outer membrane protein OmpA-like peptidoglycan-associated protein
MKSIPLLILYCLLLFNLDLQGQEFPMEMTKKDSTVSSYWLVGAGLNIVDDSEEGLRTLPTINGQWNMLPFPSRFSFGRYFKNGFGIELVGTINQYKAGNKINSVIITENIPYRAIDARITFDFNKIFGETGFFDPYAGVGFGVSNSSNTTYPTYNAVIGTRFWLSKNWAFDFNSSGKWQGQKRIHNHVQHAAGLVYRFGISESLTPAGKAKLAIRDSVFFENQKHQAALQKALEIERLLDKQEQQKQEQALVEAQQKANRLAAEKHSDSLSQALERIGTIRFAFDSSTLTASHKEHLNTLIQFMLEYPELQFEIQAHTDSRGTQIYNQNLSERRALSVKKYVVSKGIDSKRLKTIGFGETNPLIDCVIASKCTELDHSVNRRCTITVFK